MPNRQPTDKSYPIGLSCPGLNLRGSFFVEWLSLSSGTLQQSPRPSTAQARAAAAENSAGRGVERSGKARWPGPASPPGAARTDPGIGAAAMELERPKINPISRSHSVVRGAHGGAVRGMAGCQRSRVTCQVRTTGSVVTHPPGRSDLSADDILKALHSAGYRGDILRGLKVARRSGSGRAATLRLRGMTPSEITGNEFRTAVGRVLGWQLLKSTAFDLSRTARGYHFVGRGSGHGVGLCQVGSARMAEEGSTATEILRHYFPGTTQSTIGERWKWPSVGDDLSGSKRRARSRGGADTDQHRRPGSRPARCRRPERGS